MEKQLEDLKAIREMMEKSSKYLSLSGMSGVLAGFTAIAGAAFAWFFLLKDPSATNFSRFHEMIILLADALIVLTLSIGYGIYFSWKKARKSNPLLLPSLLNARMWLVQVYKLGLETKAVFN